MEVEIKKLREWICLTIKDDGKSFDVKRVLLTKGKGRLGLLGMRERLEMVGGSFEVKSAPGNGTTVTAKIPSGKPARGVRGRSPLEANLKGYETNRRSAGRRPHD
jgi:signal transduction histidine kinase